MTGWRVRLVALAVLGSALADAHATTRPPSLSIARPALAPLPRSVTVPAPARSTEPALPPAPGTPGAVALTIGERVQRYPVHGTDLASLRAALAEPALVEAAGGSHGRTRSDIGIRYTPRPVQGGCVAHDPGIDVSITTTLPEWEPAGPADPALLARWQAVAAALQAHEAQHREHALAAVRDLQAALANLGVQPDCNAVRRAVDRAFLRVRLKAEFQDARFDARTDNGRATGAGL